MDPPVTMSVLPASPVITLKYCTQTTTYKKQIKIALDQAVRTRPKLDQTQTHDAEPCKYHIYDIIHRLECKGNLAAQAVTRPHDLPNVSDGIGRREERSIQPSPSLTDEFRKSIGYIRLANGSFNIFEYPVVTHHNYKHDFKRQYIDPNSPVRICLSDQFETQNTLHEDHSACAHTKSFTKLHIFSEI